MEIILSLLFFFLCLSSLIISFVAVIQIATNDFKESKLLWIIISMIAFVGPILWLIKGRKLIIKNISNKLNNNSKKTTISEHYKHLISNIGIALKLMFIISLGLILYGYFARELEIFFFWESKSIGYILLLISIAKFLLDDINLRRKNKMHRIAFYLILGIFCLLIFTKGLIAIIIPNSDAYDEALELLKNNNELKAEVGEIQSLSYEPTGGISSQSNEFGTSGNADLKLIIKGDKKFIVKNVIMVKDLEENWKIVSMK